MCALLQMYCVITDVHMYRSYTLTFYWQQRASYACFHARVSVAVAHISSSYWLVRSQTHRVYQSIALLIHLSDVPIRIDASAKPCIAHIAPFNHASSVLYKYDAWCAEKLLACTIL
jgi:hypothetical protein